MTENDKGYIKQSIAGIRQQMNSLEQSILYLMNYVESCKTSSNNIILTLEFLESEQQRLLEIIDELERQADEEKIEE